MFGDATAWNSPGGETATVWATSAFDLVLHAGGTDAVLRRIWEARKGRGARPVVMLSPAEDESRVRVCGPQHARPIRELTDDRVLALLERSSALHFNEAASMLAREFIRIEDSALPGLRVKELLTPHFVRERLVADREHLERAVDGVSGIDARDWRPLFTGLGYRIEQLPQRGYLLRAAAAPVAVLHPSTDPGAFGHLTPGGTLPEGMLLADCEQHGADWGVLTAGGRYRLFQRHPASGAAGGQYIEIDADELQPDSASCSCFMSRRAATCLSKRPRTGRTARPVLPRECVSMPHAPSL